MPFPRNVSESMRLERETSTMRRSHRFYSRDLLLAAANKKFRGLVNSCFYIVHTCSHKTARESIRMLVITDRMIENLEIANDRGVDLPRWTRTRFAARAINS